jgi:hypothetical protein
LNKSGTQRLALENYILNRAILGMKTISMAAAPEAGRNPRRAALRVDLAPSGPVRRNGSNGPRRRLQRSDRMESPQGSAFQADEIVHPKSWPFGASKEKSFLGEE